MATGHHLDDEKEYAGMVFCSANYSDQENVELLNPHYLREIIIFMAGDKFQ